MNRDGAVDAMATEETAAFGVFTGPEAAAPAASLIASGTAVRMAIDLAAALRCLGIVFAFARAAADDDKAALRASAGGQTRMSQPRAASARPWKRRPLLRCILLTAAW